MAEYLPEELIVKIMERLPVKSLLRFTSVSKRWRSIILFDPQFAKSQFETDQTFRHRALFTMMSPPNELEFQSAHLEEDTTTSSSLMRKVTCPFLRPEPETRLNLLGSCNGLVCALVLPGYHFYIWNPSTGFFHELPKLIDNIKDGDLLIPSYYGFGYLSASDDYKLMATFQNVYDDPYDVDTDYDVFFRDAILVFSSKANSWSSMNEAPLDCGVLLSDEGTLSNEALHWVDHDFNVDNVIVDSRIVAFDLANEEFRRMRLPFVMDREFWCLGDVVGCLCVFDQAKLESAGSVDLWVMKDYGVGVSWTKLFSLKVISQPEKMEHILFSPMLVLETSTILLRKTVNRKTVDNDYVMVEELIRSGHGIEEDESVVLECNKPLKEIVQYEETLLWLG